MLRCPEAHEEAFLVLSTGEMVGRMVRSGLLGCPACQREYPIVKGVAHFSASGTGGLRGARRGRSAARGRARGVDGGDTLRGDQRSVGGRRASGSQPARV